MSKPSEKIGEIFIKNRQDKRYKTLDSENVYIKSIVDYLDEEYEKNKTRSRNKM